MKILSLVLNIKYRNILNFFLTEIYLMFIYIEVFLLDIYLLYSWCDCYQNSEILYK